MVSASCFGWQVVGCVPSAAAAGSLKPCRRSLACISFNFLEHATTKHIKRLFIQRGSKAVPASFLPALDLRNSLSDEESRRLYTFSKPLLVCFCVCNLSTQTRTWRVRTFSNRPRKRLHHLHYQTTLRIQMLFLGTMMRSGGTAGLLITPKRGRYMLKVSSFTFRHGLGRLGCENTLCS